MSNAPPDPSSAARERHWLRLALGAALVVGAAVAALAFVDRGSSDKATSRGLVSCVLAAIVCLTLTAPAQAETYTRLDQWASIFAMRHVTVQCPDEKTWSKDEIADGGWAYVPLGPPMSGMAAHTVAAPLVCAGALAIAEGRRATPPWQMALGALTLVHEAYHLRIWNHRLDEGRVNCQAIRHFKVGVRLLGGSQQLANDLLPYALSIYWELAVKAPAYHWKRCRVPSWRQ